MTPSAVPIIEPKPSISTMKKKIMAKMNEPGRSLTVSATAIKINPVPDGESPKWEVGC